MALQNVNFTSGRSASFEPPLKLYMVIFLAVLVILAAVGAFLILRQPSLQTGSSEGVEQLPPKFNPQVLKSSSFTALQNMGSPPPVVSSPRPFPF